MTYETFKEQFHIVLNEQQEAAVQQVDGPVLLLAVPGSGKTTVLVTRLGYMLYCLGIPPEQILTVTYTVAAAQDMRRRFSALFGQEYADHLQFRTINGICDTIIRHYARWKGSTPFELVSREAHLSGIIRTLFGKLGAAYPTDLQVKEVRTRITCCKNGMFTEEEIRAQEMDGVDFPALFRAYRDHMRQSGLMDFDDQMVFARQILRRCPSILAHFQSRWHYLCVDEAQDTSKIQHAILRLLAAERDNLFMVGDEDQSIYGFRAAYPQALLEFGRVYPTAKVLLMETNHRSTSAIVERADALIQRNAARHPKHMRTDNPSGAPLRRVVLSDWRNQYPYLVKVAEDCRVPTAVLYRNNDSALPLIDLLERKGLPYACRQRESFFFTSPTVRDLCDILIFALDGYDRELFLGFYYKLDLKIKRTVLVEALRDRPQSLPVLEALITSGRLESWQVGRVKALQTHFSKLPLLTSYQALNRVVEYMGYGEYLSSQRADRTKIDVLLALADQNPDLDGFLRRLDELSEITVRGDRDPACPFILSTIHSSKGLEYERVLLIDVVDGIFPATATPAPGRLFTDAELATLEEERRLFYVGVTRAKRQVDVFCYEKKFGDEIPRSTFSDELLGVPVQAEGPPSVPSADQTAGWETRFTPGVQLVHKSFGTGVLTNKTGSIAVVQFGAKSKKLDLSTCLKRGLIRLENEP